MPRPLKYLHTGLYCPLILSLLALANTAWSLPSDKEQNIEILADSAEHNEQAGVTTYAGNVTIQQGSITIRAQQVIIKANKRTSAQPLEQVSASGNPAHFEQQLVAGGDYVKADANNILYTPSSRVVQLNTNAKLLQAGSTITGDQISYNIAEHRIQAQGNTVSEGQQERVKIIIPPKVSNKSSDTKTSNTTQETP